MISRFDMLPVHGCHVKEELHTALDSCVAPVKSSGVLFKPNPSCLANHNYAVESSRSTTAFSPNNVTYQIPFYLPPPGSLSSSSSSASSSTSITEPTTMAYQTPFDLPIPGL